jgi:WD40 repeat protein
VEPLRTLTGHSAEVLSLALSPDGQFAAASGADKVVKLWEVASGREAFSLSLEGDPRIRSGARQGSLAFSPDGRFLTFWTPGAVLVWETETGRQVLTFALEIGQPVVVRAVEFSPDLHPLAVATVGIRPKAPNHPSLEHIDPAVTLWDLTSGRQHHTLRGRTGQPHHLCFSPHGQLLAVGFTGLRDPRAPGDSFTVRVWNAMTGQDVLTLQGYGSTLTAVAFSPDRRRIATSESGVGAGATIRLWDALTGQELLKVNEKQILMDQQLAFSADGQRLLAGGTGAVDGVRVWEVSEVPSEIWLRREAAAVATGLYNDLLIKEDVVRRLRADATLREPLPQAALAERARSPQDGVAFLHERARGQLTASLNIIPASTTYFRWAEFAYEKDPDNPEFITTMAVARYEQGRSSDVSSLLTPGAGKAPDSVLVLGLQALTHARLGHRDESRALRGRIQAMMDGPLGEPARELATLGPPTSALLRTERGLAAEERRTQILTRDPRSRQSTVGLWILRALDRPLTPEPGGPPQPGPGIP